MSSKASPDEVARALLDGALRAPEARVLVVGCGGIGCELLKNLVTADFSDITMIDLDTVDVSNLNRQFLFHKIHVGKSKSQAARESLLQMRPEARLVALHDSIMSSEYNVSWFKRFDLVLNALDNRQARCHVNRMCLAADVPLVESGSAGYLGQVTVIKKGLTECYECQPKPHQKTFPGCTIRNTPSEPIHCIVWAKHLFNQLFGEEDPDQDVSPDTHDPEAGLDEKNGDNNGTTNDSSGGNSESAAKTAAEAAENRVSTRQWAKDCDYDAARLFTKFFGEDIRYLLSMEKLWAERRPPEPLDWAALTDSDEQSHANADELRDQAVWSLRECGRRFEASLGELYDKLKCLPSGDHLTWDKDDDTALDFVVAVANFRCQTFHIPRKSRFDVKSMAGNIIPAIATTNAEIGGLIVHEALKILGILASKGKDDNLADIKRLCKTLYLGVKPNFRGLCVVPCQLEPPRPSCYVCSGSELVGVHLDVGATTVRDFEEKVLRKRLNFAQPDVVVDGKGIILISSEEGETEENNPKTLKEMNVIDETILAVEDFLQDFKIKLIVYHRDADKFEEGEEFQIEGEVPKAEEEEKKEEEQNKTNGEKEKGDANTRKRKSSTSSSSPLPAAVTEKRKRTAEEALVATVADDEELVCLD